MNTGLSFEQMFPGIAAVGDFLGELRPIRFDDGDWQFRIENKNSCVVYSPKFELFDLDKFCYENLDQYGKFYDKNWGDIQNGKPLPPIKFFWVKETE